MLQLHNLEGIKKARKRIGRGGSRGGTSARGHKGQRSRSGGKSGLGAYFEGGQIPLSRRLPRRGFNNSFKKSFELVGLGDLEEKFSVGSTVDLGSLKDCGLVKGKANFLIKILSNGSLSKKLTVKVDAMSKSAAAAIESAGGRVEAV